MRKTCRLQLIISYNAYVKFNVCGSTLSAGRINGNVAIQRPYARLQANKAIAMLLHMLLVKAYAVILYRNGQSTIVLGQLHQGLAGL